MHGRQNNRTVEAVTPLSELLGYSTALRIITSGNGSFSMELSHYHRVASQEQEKVIKRMTGFTSL